MRYAATESTRRLLHLDEGEPEPVPDEPVDPRIGSWVSKPDTKAHLCESVVAGEPVTRCGRRLRTGEFVYGSTEAKCKRCER